MEATLKAELREETGTGAARKLRVAGKVPAVLYGHGMDPLTISVSASDLLRLFHRVGGSNVLVGLEVNGSTHLAIPREVQRDHIHSRYVHVDFLAVRRDERITVSVEVHEVGVSVGVHAGGVVEHHLREVLVECLPGDVPEVIEADITDLEIGDMLKVGDVPAPAGATILTDPDTPVISIITPAALRTEADLTLPGEEAPEVEVEAEVEAAEEGAEEGAETEAPPSEGGGED
jgi:large subunit ribosomal protein L25